ncbi:murein hydrolase activator EnvC [Actinobacillus pleuropneumoniae]|uniref:Murein hydrolase activator EnvC n=2 Tax=Actinobacillus pleuropneumoniae TaxID=715 RepID=A0A9Q4H838_ACTPL|nr:murein hydrolase activator EnvC [Actinobacillus pleuropneumoniae]MCL7721542.1 murein hydrolase activator EnvC [Actinobacillus pleuropneumoniae]MCL7727224.1 murein hydrolase activator EnvC [Actinobacillus pleuropneumoniae]MCL7730417.1 murein hydrolase activator EnvC [Actinobacillus pleuropneumoniae]MCY6367759.1 murein hydrolase activator EnvC [Actinobacillus pleuropneumoniae]MCY6384628.1 murein hydrolase activator EnvC [Actinobacillus pleuropneumoniae]
MDFVKVFRPFYVIPLLICFSVFVQSSYATELSSIQQKIKQQQSKINEQRQKRSVLQSTLKTQEIEMGKVLGKLKETEISLTETRQAIKRTEQEIQRLEKQEKEQKEKLKEQLDSAYRSGIHPSVLERLMSESAKNADRMTAYYAHINQVRIDTINDLRRTQQELKDRRDELKGQQKGQQTQLSEQKKQEKDLKKVQNERETTLRSINKTLEQDESRLESLKSNEAALRNQLAKATAESERQEEQEIAKLEQKKNSEEKRKATEQEKQQVRAGRGLGSPKKQFSMPVAGKVVNSFGSRQMGEVTWHGVVIAASAGASVRAIAGGRVILADWLQGYGQVVVIDHGNGDMSLYGYNQSVSVRKGSRVSAGQQIASVGNSGGQNRSALYFEIRRKGNPKNPMGWVK